MLPNVKSSDLSICRNAVFGIIVAEVNTGTRTATMKKVF